MDFGNLLAQAWQIVWRHAVLFAVGVLLALKIFNGSAAFGIVPLFVYLTEMLDGGGEMDQVMPLLVATGLIVSLVWFCMWVLRIWGEGGLIYGVKQGAEEQTVTFSGALMGGGAALGRLLGLYVVLFIPIFVLTLMVTGFIVGIVVASDVGWRSFSEPAVVLEAIPVGGMIMASVLIILALPLGLAALLILPFAQRGIVLEGLGVRDSIAHSVEILGIRLGETILLFLLTWGLQIVFSWVSGIFMGPLTLIGVFGLIPIIENQEMTLGSVGMAIISMGAVVFLAAVINSFIYTYRSAIFTLAYLEFVEGLEHDEDVFKPNMPY
ncbi:MAG TPA: hypothetical protein VLL52_01545 [Anaerolineae bacterium]|nr:hypothetical protein [Anaerolineae bacterium]